MFKKFKNVFSGSTPPSQELPGLQPSKTEYRYFLRTNQDYGGRGFIIVNSDGEKISSSKVSIKKDGMKITRVAGCFYRLKPLQRPQFNPGMFLKLIAEPENPHDSSAVAVFDERGKNHVGYLPKSIAPYFSKRILSGEQFRCLSMWESIEGGKRSDLKVLVFTPDADIKMP